MIHARNLVKTFKDFTAVNDVSFDVKPGEIFAFLGPNGAGKTTTIKMLTTLLKPTSGTLAIAAASTVRATRSSASRLWTCDLPQARARVCVSRAKTDKKFANLRPAATGSSRAASAGSCVVMPAGSRPSCQSS